MPFSSKEQRRELKERVLPRTSNKGGHLEDDILDLDARAMQLMGKRQQLKRSFGFVSTTSFATTVLASWQTFACTFQGGLVNGGPSTLIYGFVLSFFGSLATAISLAELASMSPTSGGQYHWVAELAPRRFAITFSWAAGWLTAFTRIAASATVAYISGTTIEGLIILNYPSYTPKRWHATMLYWAVTLLTTLVNTLGIHVFPYIETLALVLYVFYFFALLVPLVYLAPQSSPSLVFQTFENLGGWRSPGISWCIGLITSMYSMTGIDCASHMSEEVVNAGIVVPRSMVAGMILSGTFTFAFSIAVLFSIGDLNAALNTPTTFPIIEIFYTATQSKHATNAMTAALISSLLFSSFGLMASASRLTWAFARDKGLPYSSYLAHVNKEYLIPTRTIGLVALVMFLLGLLNIVSTTAFNAMVSLTVIGQYTSYLFPITLLLMRKYSKKDLPLGPFQLAPTFGIIVNGFSIAFTVIVIVFSAFPPYRPISADNMNYSSVIFGAAILLSIALWFIFGRRAYSGPVREVIDNENVRRAVE